VRAPRRIAALAFVLAGCPPHRSADTSASKPAEASNVRGAPSDSGVASTGAPDARVATAPSADNVVAKLVDVDMPASARTEELRSVDGNKYLGTMIYVSGPCPGVDDWTRRACVSVKLEAFDRPGWKTLAEAMAFWNRASESTGFDGRTPGRSLGEGMTRAGVFYAVRSFQVRMGFSGIAGETIHQYEPIARVYADLTIGSGHVECTGYYEHGVDTPDDPTIKTLVDICTSMRRRP
jgi:hypothetical protein